MGDDGSYFGIRPSTALPTGQTQCDMTVLATGSGLGRRLYFGFFAGILAAAIGFFWNPTPLARALWAIFIACALIHAALAYGPRRASILFAMCSAIAFTMENLGTATGVPFGSYHFEVGADLPHIGRVPLIIGPLWFGAGYFSWTVASILLDGADRQLDRPFNLIALPVVAAFVMTQLDLARLIRERAPERLASVV
ncbi:putative membrane protein [Bradyrhizobium japonicum]